MLFAKLAGPEDNLSRRRTILMSLAPVALFAFNRPAHLAATLASLEANALSADTDIVVFCDGARSGADAEQVAQVRKIAHGALGFRTLEVVERERNLGLAESIASGVGRLCAERGKVIVVEDDLQLAEDFLTFMNRALDRYENEESVMQISGYQFGLPGLDSSRCVFLPIISCWGWAVWERAWKGYDASAAGWSRLNENRADRLRFDLDGAYGYFDLLGKQLAGKVDSWGIRWYLSVFMRDGLVLYPPRSLVLNAGFDGSGTHASSAGGGSAFDGTLAVAGTRSSFDWPAELAISPVALAEVQTLLRQARPTLAARLLRRLGI
jgi:hypothetical protein